MKNLKFRAWNIKEKMIKIPKTFECNSLNEELFFLQQEYVLMQYTGLKDKNGKEIFSGDIVKWDDNSNGKYWRVAVVEINPDIYFRIIKNTEHKLSYEKGYKFHYCNFIYKETEKYLEIIGNVYENASLIDNK